MEPEDLARILDDLGQRLGPTGEYVFALAVRYKVTDALVGMAFGLVLLVLALAAVRWVWRHEFHDSYDESPAKAAVTGFGAFFGLIAVWFLCANLVTVLNPEYAAIRDILGTIGGSR